MPITTYQDHLKVANAALKENPAAIQQQQQAKLNEIQAILTLQGQNPALFDYPTGNVVLNASAANGRSSVVDYGRDFYHKHSLVRIVTTIGATPTATYAIQGSNDGSTWNAVQYADSTTPTTLVNTTFVITTAGQVVKFVPAGQTFRFLSVLVSADTNVTNTIDVVMV